MTIPSSSFVPVGQAITYANEIAAFLEEDIRNPPNKDGILFVGSSILRLWSQLNVHLAPLPVLNRAFGGARTWEVLHYADRIVLPYQPKIIVYYCGSNDINAGEKSEGIFRRYQQFSELIQERLPQTELWYLAIFRAPQKRPVWNIVDTTNQLVQEYAVRRPRRGFIDANSIVFDKQGEPRKELYLEDDLHFRDEVYGELAQVVKPIIQDAYWRRHSSSRPGL